MLVGLVWWRVKKAEEEKQRTVNGKAGVKVEGEEGSVLGDLTRAGDRVFCVWLLVSSSVIRRVISKEDLGSPILWRSIEKNQFYEIISFLKEK